MKFFEFTGGDVQGASGAVAETLATLAAGRAPDRVDADVDGGSGALQALRTLSMFDPVRIVVVDNAHRVRVAEAREMAKLTHEGAVLFTGERPLSAAVRKALPELETATFPLPTPRNVAAWVQQAFSREGVRLPPSAIGSLSEGAATIEGASRIRHLAAALAAAGLVEPTAQLLGALAAGLSTPEEMWRASDAVTRGDVHGARPGPDVDPIAALTILTRRLVRVGAALEGHLPQDDLARVLGIRPGAVAMLSRGVRVGPTEVTEALDIAIDAAEQVRRVSEPAVVRVAVEIASIRIAQIFHGARAEAL